jgi:hypothetical protein
MDLQKFYHHDPLDIRKPQNNRYNSKSCHRHRHRENKVYKNKKKSYT